MQFLFIVRPSRLEMLAEGPTPEETEIVRQHFEYWKQMVEHKRALVVGRTMTTGPETLGIAIFRAESEEEATAIANGDPAVAAGTFQMEVYPYYVALLGDPGPFKPH